MARPRRKTSTVTVARPQPEYTQSERSPMPMDRRNNGPYSLASMLDFLNNNAGLLFLGLSLFIVGFLSGAMWRENTMLKSGMGTGTGIGQNVAPGGTQVPQDPAAPAVPLTDESWKKIQENPAAVLGKNNAKVTIVEFTDYQCPFCARHYTSSHKTLKEKYIDTGKVKIVFKDQPLPFHANAKIAANAARCAGEQNKFEAMHDALFEGQTGWSNLATEDAIKKFGEMATTAGANAERLMQCVRDGKFNKQIEADSALGITPEVGAGATPTFFINKQPVVGAQDLSVFEAEIEKALAS
jgi:protein-disulfide isomerase